MAKREPLAVWLHGIRIGTLTTNGKPYPLAMRYSDEAHDAVPEALATVVRMRANRFR